MKIIRPLVGTTAATALALGLCVSPALADEPAAESPAIDSPAAAPEADDSEAVADLEEPAEDPAIDDAILGDENAPESAQSDAAAEEAETAAGESVITEIDLAQETAPAWSTNAEGKRVISPSKMASGKQWMAYAQASSFNREHVKAFNATSPAMGGREIPLAVITPDGNFDQARPTLYLLNGAGGADQDMEWIKQTYRKDVDPTKEGTQDMVDFYVDKGINVVIPQAGAFSYYFDWQKDPNSKYLKGPQKWETFLTQELPGALEQTINGNGKRGIAGMSMSATSALVLAQQHPDLYDAVGSFSGCAATSTVLPHQFVGLTVNRGGATPEQIWGARGSAENRRYDGLANAEKLRGHEIYVSANSGLVGKEDTVSHLMNQGADLSTALAGSSTLTIEGGVIEAAMNACTHDLKAKMDSLSIPADWNFRNTGTHSWPGWIKDISESWPTFERAFGEN
ncbi:MULTISPECIES: alpha/beta hydrolase [unclassified Corynebacterium]|uniref:alpha/beta hydrolase n=1 Tax=unclassified Corynebacterium TaxID=2624378 RepID=UPI0034CFD92F